LAKEEHFKTEALTPGVARRVYTAASLAKDMAKKSWMTYSRHSLAFSASKDAVGDVIDTLEPRTVVNNHTRRGVEELTFLLICLLVSKVQE